MTFMTALNDAVFTTAKLIPGDISEYFVSLGISSEIKIVMQRNDWQN